MFVGMLNYAILAALLYTIPFVLGDSLSKRLVLRIGAYETGVLVLLIGMLPILATAAFVGIGTYSAYAVGLALATGIILAIGYAMFYKAIETQDISKSIAFSEFGSIIFVIFGFLVFGEKLSTYGIIGMLAVFIGAFLISMTNKHRFNKRLVPAMIAYTLWAVAFIVLAYSINVSSNITIPLLVSRGSALIAFIMIAIFIPFRKTTSTISKNIKTISATGLLDGLGAIGFGAATVLQVIGFTGVINALVPLIGMLMGYEVYKERFTKTQLYGFAIMIIGAVVVSIT